MLSATDNIGPDLSPIIYYVGPLCFIKNYLVIGREKKREREREKKKERYTYMTAESTADNLKESIVNIPGPYKKKKNASTPRHVARARI